MSLSKEQECAVKVALKGHNVFITGLAGTGKTHATMTIISRLRDSGRPAALAVTSTSGISSVVIGGVTIHSFAGIGCSGAPDHVLFDRALRNELACDRWRSVSTLILDEISMLSSRLFELLNRIACSVRSNDFPFGEVQLVFVGDFCQLPPIRSIYGDERYCFESPLWSICFPLTHCFFLRTIFRQSDPEFIKFLNELRYGKLSSESKQFLARLDRPIAHEVNDGDFPSHLPVLNPHRIECHIINRDRLHEQDGSENTIHVIKSTDSGQLSTRVLDSVLQVPHKLAIKVGSPVMVLRNIDHSIRNGTIGTVEYFMHNEFPVVSFPKSGKVLTMDKRYQWSVFKNGKVGCRLQLPLMLAYSYTVHKSQGQTLQGGVLNASGFWEPGMGYSGATRFENPRYFRITNLTGDLNFADEKVIHFYEVLEKADTSASLLTNASNSVSTSTGYDCCKENPGTCMNVTHAVDHSIICGPVDSSLSENDKECREFFESDVQVTGPFCLELSFSAIHFLSSLGQFSLTEDQSEYVRKSCSLLREIYEQHSVFQMFEKLVIYLWRTISDIFVCHSPAYLDPVTHTVEKDANIEINIAVNDLCIDEDIRGKWKCLIEQLKLDSDDSSVSYPLLSKLIFQIRQELFHMSAQKRFTAAVNKMKNQEGFQVDCASDEGKAVIRHLGGWTVFAVINELNRFISTNLHSATDAVQSKITNYVHLRRTLLNCLTISALDIHRSSSYAATLQHTDYYSRGNLTYITDNCYLFFLDLERKIENFLQLSYLIQTGKQFVDNAVKELFNDADLKTVFCNLFLGSDNEEANLELWEADNDATDDELSELIIDPSEYEIVEHVDLVDMDHVVTFSDGSAKSENFLRYPEASPAVTGSPPKVLNDAISADACTALSQEIETETLDDVPPNSLSCAVESDDQPSLNASVTEETSSEVDISNLCNFVLDSFSDSSNDQMKETDKLMFAFKKIVFKYFMCRSKNFLKVLRNQNEIKRTAAHRKKVQQRSEKTAEKKSKCTISDILKDESVGKINSHRILQGNISSNPNYLSVYTKPELFLLLDSYRVKYKKSSNKSVLCSQLKDTIMMTGCHCMPSPDFFHSSDERGQKRTSAEME